MTNQQTLDAVDRDSEDLQNTHILLDQAEQKEKEVAGARCNLGNLFGTSTSFNASTSLEAGASFGASTSFGTSFSRASINL